jgi:hypothetical protein
MNDLTVSSLINLFPSSKTEQKTFVDNLVKQVLNGEVDPLKIASQMANFEGVAKAYKANEEIKESLLKEAEKYGQRAFNAFGCEVQIKETGVKYNYSEVGHLEYNSICACIKDFEEKKANIENMMKANKETWIYTDKVTGETYEVLALAKESTTQAVLTVKK